MGDRDLRWPGRRADDIASKARKTTLGLCAAAAAYGFLAAATSANAAVAFDNYGPGHTVQSGWSWGVSTASSTTGHDWTHTEGFVSAVSGDLSRIDIALSYGSGAGTARVDLLEGGLLLGSWDVTATVPFGSTNSVDLVIPGGGVHLMAGSLYELKASASGDTYDAWNLALGTDGRRSAFDVLTSGAPEPAAWAMMLAGLFGLGAALRRTRTSPAVGAA